MVVEEERAEATCVKRSWRWRAKWKKMSSATENKAVRSLETCYEFEAEKIKLHKNIPCELVIEKMTCVVVKLAVILVWFKQFPN